jgi:hypothetical protein
MLSMEVCVHTKEQQHLLVQSMPACAIQSLSNENVPLLAAQSLPQRSVLLVAPLCCLCSGLLDSSILTVHCLHETGAREHTT